MAKILAGSLFRPSWKKISLCTCAVVLPIPLLLVTRFNISPQDSIPLSSLQKLFGIHYASETGGYPDLKIIGHRGAGGEDVIENTAGAILKGIESGTHWIEIDVRKAKGGQVILFHDETVSSLTGEPAEETDKVKDLGLKDLRSLQGAVKPDEQILSLRDALEDARFDHVTWVVDIKELGLKSELLNSLRNVPKGRIVLQGLYDIIREYKGEGYALAYAAGWGEGSNKTKFLFGHQFILERCQELEPDLQYLSLPNVFANRSLIDDVKVKVPGIRVWSWNAETRKSWERLAGLGVDGIIVDDVGGAVNAVRSAEGFRESE